MPTFQGLVSEEQLLELIEYVKSLQAQSRRRRRRAGAAGRQAAMASHDACYMPARHYLNDGYGIKSWLLTRDHKRIALLYLVGGHVLLLPRRRVRGADPPRAGDAGRRSGARDETYNKLFTMHGVMMVFFFLIPSIPAMLGNFLVPMMIGAKDLAFPKLNLRAGTSTSSAALFTLYALVTGGVDTGWTFYTPFSTVVLDHQRDPDGARHLHHRLLVDPHRAELHRHHPPDARARA